MSTPPERKGMFDQKPEDHLRDQRAERIEQLKDAMRDMVRKNHPEVSADVKVELTADAAIDLFGLGIMDSPQSEFEEFLVSLRNGEPVSVTESDPTTDTSHPI